VTQDGWAARLGYSRRTVLRWEQGAAVPDAAAEAAIIALCQEERLFRAYDQGVLAGQTVTAAWLAELLAAARTGSPLPEPAVGHLPTPLTSLIGREQELAAVAALLRMRRLITLVGPGGVGKTRLGIEAGRAALADFPDGVCFVNLAPLSDAELVPAAIAQTLRIPETPGQSLLESLRLALRHRALLLVLDTCEQVVEAAPVFSALLEACPRLRLLATSRVALRLSGEREYHVPPLALPDGAAALDEAPALALFAARARDVRADFALTAENAGVVADICRRLDGLPLAIELAAARVKLLPPAALLARLEQPLALLTGGARDLPARQRTLRATIAWSYGLLTPDEQLLLRRLSVFVDGCTQASAEAVCATHGALAVFDGLASLVDNSLVEQREGPDGEPRFHLLATVREFGLEELTARGEAAALRRRHAEHAVALGEEAEPWLKSPQRLSWLHRLDAEQGNLRAALDWTVAQGEADLGLRLVGAVFYWFFFRSHSEGRRRAEELLALPGAERHTAGRATALFAAATIAFGQGDFEAMRRYGAHLLRSSFTPVGSSTGQ
jgi:predicted ATPase